MTETNNKYTRGKIYKIVSDKSDKIYIGSTIEPTLARRMALHKGNWNAWKNGKGTYTSSYELLELEDAQIILIELYPCKSRDELLSRERYYTDLYKNTTVNKINPLLTTDEKKIKTFE